MPSDGGGGPQPSGNQVIDQTTTTDQSGTSTTTPDAFGQQVRQDVLANARNIFANPNFFYPGDLTAGISPSSLAAGAGIQALATSPQAFSSLPLADLGAQFAVSPLAAAGTQAAIGGAANLADPSNRFVSTNPYLQDAIASAAAPAIQNFAGNLLPNIRGQAIGAGQFGGSRQGIAEGLAAAGTQSAIAGIAAQMANQNYLTAGQQQLQASSILPSVLQTPLQTFGNAQALYGQGLNQAYQNLTALDAVGQQRQQSVQNDINAEIQRYMFNNSISRNDLALYASIVSGLPIGQTTTQTGTSTSSTQGITSQSQLIPQTNPLFAGLGGALGGAALAPHLAGLPGLAWMTPGYGALIGGGLALASIL